MTNKNMSGNVSKNIYRNVSENLSKNNIGNVSRNINRNISINKTSNISRNVSGNMSKNIKPTSLYNKASKALSPFCYLRIGINIFLYILIIIALIYFNFFYRKNYIKTKAKIVNKECSDKYFNNKDKKYKKTCDIEISFKDINGIEHITHIQETKNLNNNMNNNDNKNKQQIDIEYDPNYPKSTASLYTNITIINIILIVILSILIIIGIVLYIFRENPIVCGLSAAGFARGIIR